MAELQRVSNLLKPTSRGPTSPTNRGLTEFDLQQKVVTPPKFNMEPENNGSQMDFPFPGTYLQVPC